MTMLSKSKFKYSVQPGDSYQSISQMFYGTEQYAGFLSQQTGGALPVGDKISVPPIPVVGTYANASETYQQFYQTMLPVLAPQIQGPPQQQSESFWSELVEVIAVFVISVEVPWLGTVVDSTLFAGATAAADTAISEGIAAALGTAVEQGTAIGLGLTDSFSILSVAESAFTAGMGSELGISNLKLAEQLLANASLNMSEALVEMALTGKPLDIAAFVTNTIAATIASSKMVSATLPSTQSIIDTAADAAAEEIQFGKMDGYQLADDYAGALGSAEANAEIKAQQSARAAASQSAYAAAKSEAATQQQAASSQSTSASSNTPQPSKPLSQTQSSTSRLATWQAQQAATPQKDWSNLSDSIPSVDWSQASPASSTSAVAPNPTTESLSSALLTASVLAAGNQLAMSTALQQYASGSTSSGEVYSSASSFMAAAGSDVASSYPTGTSQPTFTLAKTSSTTDDWDNYQLGDFTPSYVPKIPTSGYTSQPTDYVPPAPSFDSAVQPSYLPSVPSFSNASSNLSSFWQATVKNLTNGEQWALATTAAIGKTAEKIPERLSPLITNINQSIESEDPIINFDDYSTNVYQSLKYGLFADVAGYLKYFDTGTTLYELTDAAIDVYHSPTPLKTGLVEGGGIIGGAIGIQAGVALGFLEEDISFGTLTPLAIGTAASLSMTGQQVGKLAGLGVYNLLNSGMQEITNEDYEAESWIQYGK